MATTRDDANKSLFVYAKSSTSNRVTRVAVPADFQVGAAGSPADMTLYGGLAMSTATYPVSATSPKVSIDSKVSIAAISTSALPPQYVDVYLPTSPRSGQVVYVKDASGTADVANIRIRDAAGGKIDGSELVALSVAYGSIALFYTSTGWGVMTSGGSGGGDGGWMTAFDIDFSTLTGKTFAQDGDALIGNYTWKIQNYANADSVSLVPSTGLVINPKNNLNLILSDTSYNSPSVVLPITNVIPDFNLLDYELRLWVHMDAEGDTENGEIAKAGFSLYPLSNPPTYYLGWLKGRWGNMALAACQTIIKTEANKIVHYGSDGINTTNNDVKNFIINWKDIQRVDMLACASELPAAGFDAIKDDFITHATFNLGSQNVYNATNYHNVNQPEKLAIHLTCVSDVAADTNNSVTARFKRIRLDFKKTSSATVAINNITNNVTQQVYQGSAPTVVSDASTTTKGILQLSGDLGGDASSPVITNIKGKPISSTTPSVQYQVLLWDGTTWVPTKLTQDMIGDGFKINTFTMNQQTTTIEIGAALNKPTFTATYNKIPTTSTLKYAFSDNNTNVISIAAPTPNSLTQTINSELTTSKNSNNTVATFTLAANDDVGSATSSQITVTWMYRVRYGKGNEWSTLSDTAKQSLIDGLTTKLQTTRPISISNLTLTEGQHVYYAYPAALGDATFTVNGFSGGFSKVDTRNVTTPAGPISYYVWMSVNTFNGNVTVNVT